MKKYIIALLFCILTLPAVMAQDADITSIETSADPFATHEMLAQTNKSRGRSDEGRAKAETDKSKAETERTKAEAVRRNLSFETLSNLKGVEVVYISKAMLGMVGNMNMPGVNMRSAAGKLESLQILTAESGSSVKALKEGISTLIKTHNYETLMLTKDSDSKTGFYSKKMADKTKSEILMVTEDDGEITVIRFVGNIDMKDLKDISKVND